MRNREISVYLVLGIYLFSLLVTGIGHSQLPVLRAKVWPDKAWHVLRETVELYGNVTFENPPSPPALVDQGLVGIQVKDPVNKIVARTVPTGIGEAEDWDLEIKSLYSSDSSGDPKDEVERGKWSYFYVTVQNHKAVPQDVLITLNIFDGTLIPLGLKSVKETLPAGFTTGYLTAVNLSKWATPGNAVVYANVYSDWPENAGYPLCPEKAADFTIIESVYEDPPTHTIPEQPIQNGSFATTFRLSPEPRPGAYTATVCAWYNGYHSQASSAVFVVWSNITAPPRASIVAKPPVAGANYTITFDGSFSSAEGYNDTITSYHWDFGDLQTSTAKIATHQYTSFGDYTVTLNVTDTEGFWNTTSEVITITEIHDIALTSIECLDRIYSDWLVTITIKVKNEGTFTETFDVTAYYNTSIIATTTVVSLGPYAPKTLTLQWNTTGLPLYVNYTVSAQAEILPGEADTSDNAITDGTARTRALADIDGDRDIDIFDIVKIAVLYGVTSTDPNWNIQADLQPNGKIDIFDVVLAAGRYGNTY
jgi:PKD repeat protein